MTDWVLFTGARSIAKFNMQTIRYSALKHKGLDSDKNRMRLVERRGHKCHHTLVVWPNKECPKNQVGPHNCYDTRLSGTCAEIPYGEVPL